MMAYKQQLRKEFGQAVEVKNPESLDRLLNLIVDRLGDTEQPATSVRHIEQFIKRLEKTVSTRTRVSRKPSILGHAL